MLKEILMNFRIIYTLFLLFSFSGWLFSQQQNKIPQSRFDSIFFDAATNIAATDIDRAFGVADSLYRFSNSDTQKIKSLMLTAMFYQTTGASDKTIEFALKAEKIAVKIKDYNWQVGILGFLTTEFKNIGILKERKELIDRMGDILPKIGDLEQQTFYPMYYQEQALYHLDVENYDKVWEYINRAKKHLKKLPKSPTKYMLLGVNERIHGDFFLYLEEPDSALVYFDKSLSFFEESEMFQEHTRDLLYYSIGQAHLMKNQDSLGLDYLKKAEHITELSDNSPLRIQIYKVLSHYYKENQDKNSYLHYLEMHKELQETIRDQKIKPVELLLANIKNENKSLRHGQSSLILLSVALTMVIILGFLWYRKKKKEDYQNFQKIINEYKQNGFISASDKESLAEVKRIDKIRMSEEAEQKIIEGLKAFEKGTHFRNANYALADLASEIGVNTKYLSQVLNNKYGKDFNTYINKLRINYIIQKLKTDSAYRLYKLSFLAEECGFSSHSKFSAVFKSITGLTPTRFMSYLKDEKGLSA